MAKMEMSIGDARRPTEQEISEDLTRRLMSRLARVEQRDSDSRLGRGAPDAPPLPADVEVSEPNGPIAYADPGAMIAGSDSAGGPGSTQDDDEAAAPASVADRVRKIVLARRQAPVDRELIDAQSQANDARALAGISRGLAEAGNLFANRRPGEGVDLKPYDQAIQDADRPVQQLLARRGEQRASENQEFQRNKQDAEDQARATNQDPDSDKSQVARDVVSGMIPRLKDDPRFGGASYETIASLFPMFKAEIDERIAQTKADAITAGIDYHNKNAQSRSEHTQFERNKLSATLSGRGYAGFRPRDGVVPSEAQAKDMRDSMKFHDILSDLISRAKGQYSALGPSVSTWTEPEAIKLQQRLVKIRDLMNVGLKQGKLSIQQYKNFADVVPDGTGLKANWQPSLLGYSLDAADEDNDSAMRIAARVNNYVPDDGKGSTLPAIENAKGASENPANMRTMNEGSSPQPRAEPTASGPDVKEPPAPTDTEPMKGDPASTMVVVRKLRGKDGKPVVNSASLKMSAAEAKAKGFIGNPDFSVTSK